MLQQRLMRSMQVASRQSNRFTSAPSRFSISDFRSTSVATRHHIFAQKPYSTTQEKKDVNEESNQEQAEPLGAQDKAKLDAAKEDPVQKELEAKKKELLDATDRLKRSVADYRNLQEQTKREVQAAKDFALHRFAKDLLDSIDNLDRALETVPKESLNSGNQDLDNLHSGLRMTDEILMKTLKKHGMERFDPSAESEAFDPNKHEATFQTAMPDKKDGTVFFTQSKGFLYNGRVLRAAKVGVVKNS